MKMTSLGNESLREINIETGSETTMKLTTIEVTEISIEIKKETTTTNKETDIEVTKRRNTGKVEGHIHQVVQKVARKDLLFLKI